MLLTSEQGTGNNGVMLENVVEEMRNFCVWRIHMLREIELVLVKNVRDSIDVHTVFNHVASSEISRNGAQ